MASSYTLKAIRDDLKIAIAPEGNTDLGDSFYNQRINDAIVEIATTFEMPELEQKDTSISLVTNQRSYNISSIDPLVIMSVKNVTSDTVLEMVTREEADEWDEDETGEPHSWFRYGTTLEVGSLLPSSDYSGDVLRIRYIAKPSTLSKDTDTSPLPTYMDRPLREYALSACYADLNEQQLARGRFVIYRAMMKERKRIRGREMMYANRQLNARGM